MKKNRTYLALVLLFSFVIFVPIILKFSGLTNEIKYDSLSIWFKEIGFWGILIFSLIYIIRPFIFFPITPLTIFGGYTFGFFLGTILDVFAGGTGALLAYLFTKKLGRKNIEEKIRGKKLEILDKKIEQNGFLAILYTRLIAVFPFDTINYGAGLTKVKTRDYAFATYIGIIPNAIVLNYFGSSLHDFGGNKFYYALILICIFVLIPIFIKKRKKKYK